MSQPVDRQIFIKTRAAWKDGSRIMFAFTSVKGDVKENYIATIGLAPGESDDCSCDGFFYRGHCSHLDHLKLVETLRYALTSQEVIPAPTKAVLIEAVVFSINKKIGKPLIVRGCDDWMLANSRIREEIFLADTIVEVMLSQLEEKPAEKEVIEARDVAPLNGNRPYSLLKTSPERKIA